MGLTEQAARALVMELVDGEDLSQRIARGPIPLDEALPIAKQIAEALHAAHEQGIIHRDLKPANIKVRPDGTVKVLDFGLAKLAESTAPASGSVTVNPAAVSMSPTITSPALVSGVGVLLGTAAYMSPEQAKGRPADKRCDIWAFGCVLFEMLTGRGAFMGDDVTDTLANVLKREPLWTTLPADVPNASRALLRRCLEKDRGERIADVSTAAFVLEEAACLTSSVDPLSAVPIAPTSRLRRLAALMIVATLAAAIAGSVVGWLGRQAPPPSSRLSRLSIAPSGVGAPSINGSDRDLAITPDGSRVVYVGNHGTQLFVRALDSLAPVVALTGTPRGLFISPDGQWIGFSANNSVMAKLAVTGGAPLTITTLDGFPQGATWLPDDTIVFATNNGTGLQRIAATGGSTTILTKPDRARGEADHVWPETLPGGRAVLFTVRSLSDRGPDAGQIAVLDLLSGKYKIVLRGGSHAHYVKSGHLIYAAEGAIRAVPFDMARQETHGTPVTVVPDVSTTTFGSMDADVANDGSLVYIAGGEATGASVPRVLVWVDRLGRETPIAAPTHAYMYPRLSPDGRRIVVFAADDQLDLWLWDLARLTLTRLTFEPGLDLVPIWTPDGRRLVFASDRGGGQFNLFIQAADGTGSATRLAQSASQQNATGISADGTEVIFDELTTTRQRDLRLLTLMPTPRVQPLLETPFDERGGIVSPDGNWLAYESNSSGRNEIYVRPFPNVNDGQWQISNGGGIQALWSHTGHELFYIAPDGALLSVAVNPRGTTWASGVATRVVDGHYYTGRNVFNPRQYDVSTDDKRFLMIKENGAGPNAAPANLIVVQHFDEDLKRLVPTE
jgi:eukaryotic-like serine/threonine-protein kinase